MQRVLTQEVGKWPRGRVLDFAGHVWSSIANQRGEPLDDFSRPVVEAAQASLEPPRRGPGRPRKEG
jgi:hypothetical protein